MVAEDDGGQTGGQTTIRRRRAPYDPAPAILAMDLAGLARRYPGRGRAAVGLGNTTGSGRWVCCPSVR